MLHMTRRSSSELPFTLLHTRTSRRHNHAVPDPPDDHAIAGETASQPYLELEPRSGHLGALFALVGETTIGNTWRATVPVHVHGMNERHARVFFFDGAWYLQNVNPRFGTTVNGTRLGVDARALDDGDRIGLDRDHFVLRFHAQRPPLIGIAPRATGTQGWAWVTFCPWSADPRLEYAMSRDGLVCTACADERVSTFTSRSFGPIGVRARVDDGTRAYDDDVAGVRWADLLWRTNEQRATVDGRLLLATASLMMRGGDLFHSRMFVAWSGVLTWHARAAPPPRPLPAGTPPRAAPPTITEHMRNASRPAHLVHLIATAAGCTRVRRTSEFLTPDDFDVLLDHKKALATLALESDVRAALARMIDTALASPNALGDVIERERAALGALEPSSIAGLVARVFPDEHAQHQRIVEDARLLGVDGIVKLRR